MPILTTTRIYPMADGTLKQEADQLALRVTRDITQFNTRNVTADTVTALQGVINLFDNAPTDDELMGPLNAATDIKNAQAEQLQVAIRSIRNMADIKFKGKGYYNSFGFEGMTNMTDNDLYRLAKRVTRVGTILLTQLSSEGLTAAILTALGTLTTNFDTAIDTQAVAIETRDLATQDRIVKGNTLYAEMVRLCSIGKALFVDTDEARYNDYVLTDTNGTPTPPPLPPPPPPPPPPTDPI